MQNFFHIRLKFDKPKRVTNVRVQFGTVTGQGYYLESKEEFLVTLHAKGTYPSGALSVDYDIIPEPLAPRTEPDEQEWSDMKEAMPEPFREGEYRIVSESETDEDIRSALAPESGAAYSPYVRLEIGGNVFYGRSYYKVVPAGKLPDSTFTGVPAYRDYRAWMDPAAGTLNAQGTVPVSSLSTAQLKELAAQGLSIPKGASDHIVNGVVFAFPKLEPLGTLNNLKDYVMDGSDFVEFSEKLLEFNKQVYAECHGPSRELFKDWVNDTYDNAAEGLVLKYAVTGIGLVTGGLTLAVPGAGQLALGTAYTALGDMIKDQWEADFDRMKREFEANKKWRDDMADSGVLPRCDEEEEEKERDKEKPRRDDRPDIEVVMIYDPSGYVYEGMPSNRLEGVVATVSYKDTETGLWHKWDADWFGQVNPQKTNREGRYGWDVPEGLWQVLYEKEGYQAARSAELQVLPPHFDVNIPMVSYQPPKVKGAYSVRGGEAIHFAFDKPIRVDSLTADAVDVADGKGDRVAGTVEPLNSENGTVGEQLAMTFRFIPAQPIQAGQTYGLKISQSVLSYARVAMEADYDSQVFVAASDAAPGEGANALQFVPASGMLELHWEETERPEAAAMNVYWREKGTEAFQGPAVVVRGITSYLITDLKGDTAYEVRIATVNEAGVESVGITGEAKTFPVEELIADTAGPEPIKNAAIAAGRQELKLTWEDPDDSDLRHVVVFWKRSDVTEAWSRAYVEKGNETMTINDLEADTPYTIRLRAEDRFFLGSETVQLDASTETPQQGPGQGPVHGDGGPSPAQDPSPGNAWNIAVGTDAKTYSGFDGEIVFSIPANAWTTGQTLQFKKRSDDLAFEDRMTLRSAVFHWDGALSDPALPIEMSIRYDAPSLSSTELRQLGIYKWDTVKSVWVYRGGILRSAENSVTASIDSMGTYAVFHYRPAFQDMVGHWAAVDVHLLAARHVVNGMNEQIFVPAKPVSRAEAVKMIMGMKQQPGGQGGYVTGTDASTFADVAPDAWYFAVVEAAAKAGLVKGEQGRFRPNGAISREELAVILYRAMGSPALPANAAQALQPYKDGASISAWAQSAMAWAAASELIQGTDEGRLNPERSATRAETAVILRRLMDTAGLIGE